MPPSGSGCSRGRWTSCCRRGERAGHGRSSGGAASSLGRPENMVHQTMKIRIPRAIRASTMINHMVCRWGAVAGVAILGALAGCGSLPPGQAPAPVEQRRAAEPAAAAPAAAAPAPAAAPADPAPPTPRPPAGDRSKARWVSASWADLPGFAADRSADLWPALQAGCARPAPGWSELCARALLDPPAGHEATRRWLMAHLQPWRVESTDGSAEGLATGYFEPTIRKPGRRLHQACACSRAARAARPGRRRTAARPSGRAASPSAARTGASPRPGRG
jgi:hypothetical protein